MPISINLLTICCSRISFCNFHWLPFAVEMNAVAVAGLERLSPFRCQLAFNYELDKIPNDASKEKRESIGSEMSHNFCRFFPLLLLFVRANWSQLRNYRAFELQQIDWWHSLPFEMWKCIGHELFVSVECHDFFATTQTMKAAKKNEGKFVAFLNN